MGKGDETRQAVLTHAAEVARRVGLGGLTIGALAEATGMSKSGLFAHFRSKEALQLAVLDYVRADFETTVGAPVLRTPRGERRLRELFDRWMSWEVRPGGCPLIAAAAEFDDQPGPVRDRIASNIRDVMDMISTVFRTGIAEGQFRPDADPEQFAQDMHGVILAFHLTLRLLDDDRARARAQASFDALIERVRIGVPALR